MTVEPGSIDHLSQVISQVVAPSFLLGAVASFVSILFMRMNTVLDRIRTLNAIPDESHVRTKLKADIPRLRRRAKLLNMALLLAISSGVAATILIIVAFATALAGVHHVWGAAVLFMISLTLLCVSLVVFAFEARIALTDYDHY
jgi:uncharacterized BrkB/YihY/UPF0761 family membrane protein